MRNLKKILALALALVMSMSLMATANAFSDDKDITDTYKTAVDVLSGLKVFQGYEDGSFDPKGAITRAEVAAIIYRIVTGDVEDTQKGIYADYNKFDDVKSTSWYAGYVNFCANAEYIKGYDATHFGPNDPVTGYQALAMILRALGYDKNGEFTGTSWQVQTAAVGKERGITDNITAGTLQSPAPREVVAEILFQAILVDMVNYTPAFGYQIGDISLGEKTFGLKEIAGVVVANEYADLYSASPMGEGKTELNVDGDSYVLDYTTTLEDIGEARHAYVAGSTVLTIADAGNTVFETGEGTEVNKSNTGMKLDEDVTEYFVNFDNGMQDSAEVAEYFEIEYVQAGTQNGTGVYKTVKYRVGTELDKDDLAVLKTSVATLIAKENAEDAGDTYVYKTRDEVELSNKTYYACEFRYGRNYEEDEINYDSWKGFSNKYLTNDDKIATAKVTASDNGEWLKVIDNDNDGVADVVLLTEFAMSVIDRITRDDEYVLANLANTTGDNNVSIVPEDYTIDSDDVATEDELAEGDVVVWTLIDGVYYVDIADMITETVDKKGINSKDETMTCDGTVYEQSHIGYTGAPYYNDVTEAHTEETYDLYLDHFGYIRLFIESDYNTFMLLTDASYEDDRRVETFQAMYWNVDADEEQQIDVADAEDVDAFIDTLATGDQETWNRLYGADWTYFFDQGANYVTNIAGYAETDDGYALKTVGNSTSRVDYFVRELQDDAAQELDDCLKEQTLDGTAYSRRAGAVTTDDVRIQTTTDTQYYLVIKDFNTRNRNELFVSDVITWTGYKNAPDTAMLEDAVGYAVTHDGNGNYEVADVVVFEVEPYNDLNTYFVYEYNNWDVNHPLRVEQVWGIGYDEDGKIADQRIDVEADDAWVRFNNRVKFYEIYDDETVEVIDGNYAASDIYAGEVTTTYDVSGRDYIRVAGTKNSDGELYIYPETAAIYKLSMTVDNAGNIEYDVATVNRWDLIVNDEPMILFTDGKDNVEYAIAVGQSLYDYDDDGKLEYVGLDQAGDEMITALTTLYKDIKNWKALTWEEQADAVIGTGLTDDSIDDAEDLLVKVENVIATTESVKELTDATKAKEALDDAIADYYKALLAKYNATPALTAAQKAEAGYDAKVADLKDDVVNEATYKTACAALDDLCKAYKDALAEAQAEAVALLNAYAKQLETNNKLTTVQAADLATALAAQIKAVNDDEATKAGVADIVAADEAGEVSGTGVTALKTAIAGAVSTDDQNAVDTTVAAINAAMTKETVGEEIILTMTLSDTAPRDADIKDAVEEAVEDLAMNGATIEVGNATAPNYDAETYEDIPVVVTITVTKKNAKETVDVTVKVTSTDWQDVAEYDVPADLSAEFTSSTNLTKDAVIEKINDVDGLSGASITSGWPEYPDTFEEDVAVTINFSATYTEGVAFKTVSGSIKVTLNETP